MNSIERSSPQAKCLQLSEAIFTVQEGKALRLISELSSAELETHDPCTYLSTFLFSALASKCAKVAQVLFERLSPQALSTYGYNDDLQAPSSSLLFAITSGVPESAIIALIKKLAPTYPEILYDRDIHGDTVLHLALSYRLLHVSCVLINLLPQHALLMKNERGVSIHRFIETLDPPARNMLINALNQRTSETNKTIQQIKNRSEQLNQRYQQFKEEFQQFSKEWGLYNEKLKSSQEAENQELLKELEGLKQRQKKLEKQKKEIDELEIELEKQVKVQETGPYSEGLL